MSHTTNEENAVELNHRLKHVMEAQKVHSLSPILRECKELTITEAILRKTKIGFTINKLRKSEDAEVAALSRELYLKWKDSVAREKKAKSLLRDSEENFPSAMVSRSATPTGSKTNGKTVSRTKTHTIKTEDFLKMNGKMIPRLLNKEREYVAKAIFSGLGVSAEAEGADVEDIAIFSVAIEAKLYSANHVHTEQMPSKEYKTKFRSLLFNLKKNGELRKHILDGSISPERLISMSAEEMATREFREEISKLKSNVINDSMRGQAKVPSTDQFKCGKCGKRKTTYHQMQTRSADEPMTTFITCLICGNSWRQ